MYKRETDYIGNVMEMKLPGRKNRKELRRKHGCCEGGYGGGWGGRGRRELERYDPLPGFSTPKLKIKGEYPLP